tara:strand:- start:234 stop:380 length:147 start_codon:yes stop_codon:yes gene_type:complete
LIEELKGSIDLDHYRHEYDLIEYFKPVFNATNRHTGCSGLNELLRKNK